MKGKILAGIVLGCIGAIYVFLIYPLLKSSDFRDKSTESVILSESGSLPAVGRDPGDSMDSSPAGLRGQNDDRKKPEARGQQPAADTICFNTTCFSIEIADTPATRQQGLMNRESLPQDAGMLFVFDTPGSYGFWMKNTLIPLDIIRLDQNFVVVDTATMTPCTADPCPSYNHRGLALYVLEINAGLVQEYGIQPGDIFTQQ